MTIKEIESEAFLKFTVIKDLETLKKKVKFSDGKEIRFKIETKHWYGFSEPFLSKDKYVLDISKETMQILIDEAINKAKERIDELLNKRAELYLEGKLKDERK